MKRRKESETADEVLQETRRIKEALAKSMNFDLARMLKEARRRQKRGGRKVLSPPVRPTP